MKILGSANQDLLDGFNFYECQDKGLGVYFLDTLFSDIDSLIVYAGIHPVYFNRPSSSLEALSLCSLLPDRGRQDLDKRCT